MRQQGWASPPLVRNNKPASWNPPAPAIQTKHQHTQRSGERKEYSEQVATHDGEDQRVCVLEPGAVGGHLLGQGSYVHLLMRPV